MIDTHPPTPNTERTTTMNTTTDITATITLTNDQLWLVLDALSDARHEAASQKNLHERIGRPEAAASYAELADDLKTIARIVRTARDEMVGITR